MATWQRLLEDRDAERAWKVIDDIAQALRPEAENLDPGSDPGVAGGTAGLALFYAYLGAETGSEEWTGLAHRLMEHSIDALSERPLLPDFYEGFTGIGWAIDHLQGMLFEEPDDDGDDPDADPIGESLVAGAGAAAVRARRLRSDRRSRRLRDLRVPCSAAACRTALARAAGPAAHRDRRAGRRRFLLVHAAGDAPRLAARTEPDGRFNLGVSHGVAAVISVLGMCAGCRRDVRPSSGRLLDRAVDWLLAQKQNGKNWCFANSVIKGRPAGRDRLAWCYGDPGIAAALFTAARHCGHAGWEAEALDVARTAARRADGNLGDRRRRSLSWIGRPRLISSTGCTRRAAIRSWPRRRARGTGTPSTCSGPASASRDTNSSRRRAGMPLTGFLAGLAGVGLGLLARRQLARAGWDQFLAVSVPLEQRSNGTPAAASTRRERVRQSGSQTIFHHDVSARPELVVEQQAAPYCSCSSRGSSSAGT